MQEPLTMNSIFVLRRICSYSVTKLIPACTIEMTIIMIIYVDDCLLAGDESAIEDVLTHLTRLQGPFTITQDDNVTGFTGCSFTFNEAGIKVHQTKLVKTLEQYVPANRKEVKTPAPPALSSISPMTTVPSSQMMK